MSYEMCLEKAGAKVLAFKSFGSYQGEWFAKVEYQGEVGWIAGYYGSCSGCDAFESEFGWVDDHCDEHRYVYDMAVTDACPECAKVKVALEEKYADFGRTYLGTMLPQEKQVELLTQQIGQGGYWNEEMGEVLEFVLAN